MARVSLIEEQDHPELAAQIATIRGGRRGTLSMIYRLMLHSPAAAMAWYEQNSSLRWQTGLDGFLRELVILRVAVVTGCEYVRRVHVGVYAAEEGFTQAQVDAVGNRDACWGDDASPEAALFEPRLRAALAYMDSMTRDVTVPDPVFAALKPHFDERQIVELTMLVAAYNMLTRVLTALEADLEPLPPKKG
jgi:4-carboxymuconolactone decarboxylase